MTRGPEAKDVSIFNLDVAELGMLPGRHNLPMDMSMQEAPRRLPDRAHAVLARIAERCRHDASCCPDYRIMTA